MSWLSDIMADMAPIIIDQFADVCDLKDLRKKNVAGQMVEDSSTTVIYTDIPCAFEPWRMHTDQQFQLNLSGVSSGSVTHTIMMPATPATLGIKQNYIITVRARDGRPIYVFEQPLRLDESLSPLVLVGAILLNQ